MKNISLSYSVVIIHVHPKHRDLALDNQGVVRGVVAICTSSRLFTAHVRDGPLRIELVLRWCGILWSLSNLSFAMAIFRSLWYYLGYFGETVGLRDVFLSLPLSNQASLTTDGVRIKRFDDFVLHNTEEDDFLQKRIYDRARSAELPPTMLIGSWHDCFIQDTFADYRAVRDEGNKNVYMRIFEGTHIEMYMKLPLIFEMLSDFTDALTIEDKDLPISLAVLGEPGKWIKTSDWPILQSSSATEESEMSKVTRKATRMAKTDITFYLVPQGDEGELHPDSREEESFFEYTYFPDNPVPAIGGNGIGIPNSGQRVQNRIEEREDVCVYVSEVLREDVLVVGIVKGKLEAINM